MSEAREQSYYEIALTNRQVMSIFIVLLVCLLASFVSGVWIGRQGAGVRVQTADAQRIEGEDGDGGAPLGEMDFFRRGSAPASGGTAAAGDGAAAVAATAEPPAAAARKPPEPPPPATGTKPATGSGAPPPRAAAEPPAPRAGPSPAPPGDEAASEFLYIQVFSSIDRDQARSIVDKLRGDGYAAFLSSVEVEGRLMHRVRIGPYSERPEAEGVAEEVRRKHKLSTWITP